MAENQGHEADAKPQAPDAYDLSEEDFRATLARGGAVETPAEEKQEPPEDSESGDSGREAEAHEGEEKKQPEKPEYKPFRLDEETQTGTEEKKGGQAADTFEITHRGQRYQVDRNKLIALAQKGFDYDAKVGPHQQLIRWLEADPDAQRILAEHWKKKAAGTTQQPEAPQPKLKPIGEYEDERQWLADNVKELLSSYRPPAQPQAPSADPRVTVAESVLRGMDPEGFDRVVPQLMPLARKHLTVEDYNRINNGDIQALVKFYQWARPIVLGTTPGNGNTPAPGSTPSAPQERVPFRAKSSGAAPKQSKQDDAEAPWAMSDKEFRAKINRALGLG